MEIGSMMMVSHLSTTKRILFGAFLTLALIVPAMAATVDITATPSSGPRPLNVTLNWTSQDVDNCVKNGVSVPLVGSEEIIGLTSDTTYNIACTGGKNYTDVSWDAPTTNVDGTPIPPTGLNSLAGFELYYSTSLATVDSATPIILGPTLRTYRITGQPNSIYYYKMRAFNVANARSDYTQAVNNTINLVSVSDAVTVDVQAFVITGTVVYNVVKRNNGFVMVAVGTVPPNTICDPNQSVNGYNVVPVSSVTWSGTVRPVVVVAQCSEQ